MSNPEPLVECICCGGAGVIKHGKSCPVCWLAGYVTAKKKRELENRGKWKKGDAEPSVR